MSLRAMFELFGQSPVCETSFFVHSPVLQQLEIS